MKAFAKIRDMEPGEVSTQRELALSPDDPVVVQLVKDYATAVSESYPEAWMVTVEFRIGLSCILPQP